MNTSSAKKIFGLLCFVLIIAGGVFFFWRRSHPRNPRPVGSVSRGDLLQRVTIAGTVTPAKKSVIAAPYNGYVKKIFVGVGARVKTNDPLVSVSQSLSSTDDAYPLRAPFPGTVVQIAKSEGEFVKEGDSKEFIMRVDDLSRLYIVADAPEIDRVKVKLRQEGIVKASAIVDRSYKAVITELAQAANEPEQYGRSQVVQFPIRLEILDADESIKPGMSVVIDIITAKRENVLMLRHEFIRRDKDAYFVVTKDGQKREIKVGLQNEDSVEITEGLREGESIQQVDFSELPAQS